MSFKLYFLHFHLDIFPDNMGAVSDEHGETFHHEIYPTQEVQWKMESKYVGWLLLDSY